MGILPTRTQTSVINNILNVHSGIQVENIPRIQELLKARHAIDIESTDDNSNSDMPD